MNFVSKSLKDTDALAREFLSSISKKTRKRGTIVGLVGDLGSGKTAFVQCIARVLGVTGHITSPTFVIMKRYRLVKKFLISNFPACAEAASTGRQFLIHIDAYRLKSGEELLALGWHGLASDPANLIFIEWPERVEEILPGDFIKLNFEFVNETTRKIWFEERIEK